ncbi:hypothetical protein NEMIN01_1587 [Nematocida minor]|uniref:uncharacterized protein n=1 Tax=Nematocida minor TaxID=1912983 RepID=UPI002220872C|nr:uncharacterized protein NEMIN01_1587 [Nematocida minor]KAI5191603.1 hypothetical protein NEMIN01_1587 [Nematocida minor]
MYSELMKNPKLLKNIGYILFFGGLFIVIKPIIKMVTISQCAYTPYNTETTVRFNNSRSALQRNNGQVYNDTTYYPNGNDSDDLSDYNSDAVESINIESNQGRQTARGFDRSFPRRERNKKNGSYWQSYIKNCCDQIIMPLGLVCLLTGIIFISRAYHLENKSMVLKNALPERNLDSDLSNKFEKKETFSPSPTEKLENVSFNDQKGETSSVRAARSLPEDVRIDFSADSLQETEKHYRLPVDKSAHYAHPSVPSHMSFNENLQDYESINGRFSADPFPIEFNSSERNFGVSERLKRSLGSQAQVSEKAEPCYNQTEWMEKVRQMDEENDKAGIAIDIVPPKLCP